VEYLFNLFLWGTAGAMGLAFVGAGFGGLARAAAQLNGKTPERSVAQAVSKGLMDGGLFMAAIGFLAGVVIGWQEPTLERGVTILTVIVVSVMILMAMAALFATLAYFFVWLGVRGTGALLALGIVLAFAGIQAERTGMDPSLVGWLRAVIGLAGLVLVLSLRLRPTKTDELVNCNSTE
jgi:hypothetical protein